MLAGILAVASQTQSVYQGMAMLFIYALGLGLPFVLVGLAMARWRGLLTAFKRHASAISPASGVILIGMGLLVFSGPDGADQRLGHQHLRPGTGPLMSKQPIPTCSTGVIGRLRFVLQELREIRRGWRKGVSR